MLKIWRDHLLESKSINAVSHNQRIIKNDPFKGIENKARYEKHLIVRGTMLMEISHGYLSAELYQEVFI